MANGRLEETRQEKPVASMGDPVCAMYAATIRSPRRRSAIRSLSRTVALSLLVFLTVSFHGQDAPQAQALERALVRAVERDDSDTVLRLLDGLDAKEFGFSPWLHVAARHESPEVAALLIERGAKVNARDDNGWTPLHYALLDGHDRPAFRTAKVLLEQGADVRAATAAVGWTPLHLAAILSGAVVWPDSDEPGGWMVVGRGHGPDVLDIVQTLIERGADVGARTRIGGWSPARVAKASDGHRRYGLAAGASSEAVLVAIQAAGGKDEGCDDAPMLPTYVYGHVWRDPRRHNAAVAPGCEYNLPFVVPAGAAGYHYDAAAGNLVEVLVDGRAQQPTGENALCRWRDKRAALEGYRDALSALRVGESPSWRRDPGKSVEKPLWEGSLPARSVSAAVVESQLERLRGLPDVARVRNADLDSRRWRVVVAGYVGVPRPESVNVCEGVVLVRDGAKGEWHSIYDCAHVHKLRFAATRYPRPCIPATAASAGRVSPAIWKWISPHAPHGCGTNPTAPTGALVGSDRNDDVAVAGKSAPRLLRRMRYGAKRGPWTRLGRDTGASRRRRSERPRRVRRDHLDAQRPHRPPKPRPVRLVDTGSTYGRPFGAGPENTVAGSRRPISDLGM